MDTGLFRLSEFLGILAFGTGESKDGLWSMFFVWFVYFIPQKNKD